MNKGLHTFDEWREAGYRVKKGARMCGRNEDGIAVFSSNDVYYPFGSFRSREPVDYDFDAGGDFDNGIETFS